MHIKTISKLFLLLFMIFSSLGYAAVINGDDALKHKGLDIKKELDEEKIYFMDQDKVWKKREAAAENYSENLINLTLDVGSTSSGKEYLLTLVLKIIHLKI